MPFSSDNEVWNGRYEELLEYKKENGDCKVPRGYAGGLERWVNKQRAFYRKETLPFDRVRRLNEIGFIWNRYFDSWNYNFEQLLEFKREHGHTHVPRLSRTKKLSKLGRWVKNQRFLNQRKSKTSLERIARLESIGFQWGGRKPKIEPACVSEDDAGASVNTEGSTSDSWDEADENKGAPRGTQHSNNNRSADQGTSWGRGESPDCSATTSRGASCVTLQHNGKTTEHWTQCNSGTGEIKSAHPSECISKETEVLEEEHVCAMKANAELENALMQHKTELENLKESYRKEMENKEKLKLQHEVDTFLLEESCAHHSEIEEMKESHKQEKELQQSEMKKMKQSHHEEMEMQKLAHSQELKRLQEEFKFACKHMPNEKGKSSK